MKREDMIAFENDIADEFARGKIKSPVHLSGGNEDQLLEIFEDIKPWDWVFGGWRSHYLCLLKGVPQEKLKDAILSGHSVSLCFPKEKVFCSGICGGIAPIAVGLAHGLKKRMDDSPYPHSVHVHCFLGDMSARMGIVHEAMQYASGHDLPVKWYIDDNALSVATFTEVAWGMKGHSDVQAIYYELTRPHVGIGKWVKFN